MVGGLLYKITKMIKVLIVYSRDIESNDSGGSNTTIMLANYLAAKSDVECYTLFSIESGASDDIHQIKRCGEFKEQLAEQVQKLGINVVLVPEAIELGLEVKSALKENSNCKIVSALHNMPGYERKRLHILFLESLIFNTSIVKRLRAAICLALFPIVYYLYTRKLAKRFKAVYEASDKLVLLSDKFFDDFVKIYKIKDRGEKLAAIGNGLTFEGYASKEDIDTKRDQIVVVSRFDERQKQLSLVLKIWKSLHLKYPTWDLVIVGFGRSEKYYRHLVKRYKLTNIHFTGKAAPLQYYKESKIFLMTSAYEGWGMTITESQQMGTVPVVMNTFKSVVDLIDNDENGYIVDSVKQSVERVELLINDQTLYNEMATRAVESSKRFTRETIYEKYYNLIFDITNSN